MRVSGSPGCPSRGGVRLTIRHLVVLAISLFGARPLLAAPKALVVDTWVLGNGLNVVYAARQGAPLVTVQIVYHVGSRDEKPGQQGLARVMRELMWRGSKRVPPGVHSRLVTRLGGSATSMGDEDFTSFGNTLPSPYLDFTLALEAERMRGLVLFDDVVDLVKQAAVAARQRQVDQSAVGKAIDLLRAEVFGSHPYAHGVAGVAADLRRLTVDECQAFYDRYFVPNNATLVIVGALPVNEVKRLVSLHFDSLPPGAKLPRMPLPAADRPANVRMVRLPIELPMVAVGAALPQPTPEDRAALAVLAEALAGGSAGLLNRNLVGPDMPAVAAGGAPAFWRDAAMLVLFAVHRTDRPQEEVRRALMDQVANLRQFPLTPTVLAHARLRAAEAISSRLSSSAGLAQELARSVAAEGNPRSALLRPEQLLAVTDTDVGRVANIFLNEARLQVLLLSPEGTGAKSQEASP